MMTAALLMMGSTLSLEPADAGWVVRLIDGRCNAVRTFGPAGQPTTVAIRPDPSLNDAVMTLLLPPRTAMVARGTASVSTDTIAASARQRWTGVRRASSGFGVDVRLGRAITAGLERVSSITIDLGGGEGKLVLATGPMLLTARQLFGCQRNLAQQWGVDPATIILPPPEVHAEKWFSYPAEARQGEQGPVDTITAVDPDGSPVSCKVVTASGYTLLDQATCRMILAQRRVATPIRRGDPPVRHLLLRTDWRSIPVFINDPKGAEAFTRSRVVPGRSTRAPCPGGGGLRCSAVPIPAGTSP